MKSNLPLHGAGQNNLPPSKTIRNDQNKEALAGAAVRLSLFSLPNKHSTRTHVSQNSARMKCDFHHQQTCFLDHFDDPVLDGAVIYTNDFPFQYNKREGSYVGSPTDIFFVAATRDHEFLLSQRSIVLNISSNLNNFRELNVIENSRNLIHIEPANTGDAS